jgi:DNA-binding CsgD family transcriptional regulator
MTTNKLTAQEVEIVQLICQQYSFEEISRKLSLPLNEIIDCQDEIQKKIGAKSEVGIVVFAIKNEIFKI